MTTYQPGPIDHDHIAGETATLVALEAPEAAHDYLLELTWPDDREACWVLYLDTKHRVLTAEMASLGSLDHTFMSPRELLRGAMLVPNCAAIILAHNHPSGDPEPSKDDAAVTRRVTRAADLVGIDLLDHLILGHPTTTAWVSCARRGMTS